MLDSERTFKIRQQLFAFKDSCMETRFPISSKLKRSRVRPRSFKKAIIEFYKLHANGKH